MCQNDLDCLYSDRFYLDFFYCNRHHSTDSRIRRERTLLDFFNGSIVLLTTAFSISNVGSGLYLLSFWQFLLLVTLWHSHYNVSPWRFTEEDSVSQTYIPSYFIMLIYCLSYFVILYFLLLVLVYHCCLFLF